MQYQCFLTLSILHFFTAARAITPDEPDDSFENASDAPDSPPSPPSPEGHGRQKSSAALLSFKSSAFLARISALMSQATADVISYVRNHYYVPDGDKAAQVEDKGWYRAGLKLLLLPFLLFDLLHEEVEEHNSLNGTHYQSPVLDLIAWVFVLLEWYRLYR